ncbi:MAG: D-alanyl-D-alanine carboxypeptidase, partial [Fimbriimonadaceae bacterium]|nr:D-alanyl-D-alanine carboxypeptidase [Alphaproteobacteria bacterium]
VRLDDQISNSRRAAAMPASKLGLPLEATISLDTALRILIVKSANDVAVMIAEHVSGSVENFAAEMNEAARDLEMHGSTYVNPNGLPNPEQITTARDMARLARAILTEFPQYNEIFGLTETKFGRRNLRSHNSLLRSYDGADGMKTGFICASGFNVVASATRDGRRLIVVVLGASSGSEREKIASEYLELGFANAWTNPMIIGLQQASIDGIPQNLFASAQRPVHMGPVVCRRRYPETRDPNDIDRWSQNMADLAATVVIPSLRPGPLPSGVAVTEARFVPLPTLRPAS